MEKIYSVDFLFASMLRFEVHMLGKSTGLPQSPKKWTISIQNNSISKASSYLQIDSLDLRKAPPLNLSPAGIAIKYGTQFSGEIWSFKMDQRSC